MIGLTRVGFLTALALVTAQAITAQPALARCKLLAAAADFERIRNHPAGSYCLSGDIAFSAPFEPIDNFTGKFDGRGHTISGLQNNLFNTLSGTVKRLTIKDATLDENDGFLFNQFSRYVGIVAGDFEWPGIITAVKVTGTIDLSKSATAVIAGGLVGFAGFDSEISGSAAAVHIKVNHSVTGYTGELVGRITDAAVSDSHSVGEIQGVNNAFAGGLIGSIEGDTVVSGSTASVLISGGDIGDPNSEGDNSFAGGFAGFIGPDVRVEDAAGTGLLGSFGSGSVLGGFAGKNFGTVTRSVATTQVGADGSSNAIGGFIGDNAGSVTQSLSTDLVFALGPGNRVGGFFGDTSGAASECAALSAIDAASGQLAAGGFSGETFSTAATTLSYAIGRVTAGAPEVTGGFNGVLDNGGQILSSYWTPATTGQKHSQGGAPLGIGGFTSRLPPGFPPTDWRITKGIAPPYLKAQVASPGFLTAQLATIIKDASPEAPGAQEAPAAVRSLVYVFPPIRQFDETQYAIPATHEDAASLGAIYTMLARGIGITDNIASLRNVTIDSYFDDATQKTKFRSSLALHATLGTWTTIADAEPIGEANVVGPIRAHQAVIINGTYDNGDGIKNEYLLATSFTDRRGVVTALVADDPWTGQQVFIDPVAKTVIRPAGYPLQGFKVTQFQTVTLN